MRQTEIAVFAASLWFAAPALAEPVPTPDPLPTPRYHCADPGSEAVGDSAETAETTPPRSDEPSGQAVGKIRIHVKPIFDLSKPEENNWLFRGANYLKVPTDTQVIDDYLLFEQGEPYNPRLLEESERILRSRKFLRDAKIVASDPCAEQVDIDVTVKDVWTLLPDVSFTRGGGENSSRLGFRDSDFLGSGKSVIVVRKQDNERTGVLFAYGDPNVLGTHNELDLQYQDNDDGDVKYFNLTHPFYSLDDRWSAGVQFTENMRTDTLYELGDEVQEFSHDERFSSVFFGWSAGLVNGRTHRWLFGYTEEKSDFSAVATTDPLRAIPIKREYRYPWISWQLIEDQFQKTRHVNQMSQTEDINFGWNAFVQVGAASESFNSPEDATIVRFNAQRYRELSTRFLHFQRLSGSTYWHSDGPRNQVVHWLNRFYYTPKSEQQWFANIELSRGWDLFVDQPLSLGGDTGLRGYPIRYQHGDHRVLLNLERRFYIAYDVWSLFDIGGAIYADYGRAWNEGEDNGVNDGWLGDVGFGIRLSPTRTGSEEEGAVNVLHIDIATPLVRKNDPELDEWQLLITLKSRF